MTYSALYYTALVILTLSASCLALNSPDVHENNFDIDRIVTDSFKTENPNQRTLSPLTSSHADVVGSMYEAGYSSILSKDEKIIFVSTLTASLLVIDVSDRASMKIISSLSLTKFFFKLLALSKDGSILFVGSWNLLEIIDVSDLKNPSVISATSFNKTESPVFSSYKPSMYLNPNEDTLYLACVGLTILNISNLKTPKLIKSIDDNLQRSMALTTDGQTLFLGHEQLEIHNVSTPSNPQRLFSSQIQGRISSMEVTSDGKKLYAVIVHIISAVYKSSFEVYDILSKITPSLNKKFQLSLSQLHPNLKLSHDETNLFIAGNLALIVMNTYKETFLEVLPQILDVVHFVTLSVDGRHAYVTHADQISIINLYFNIQLSNIYNLKSTLISKEPLDMGISLALSPDETVLAIENYAETLDFYDITNKNNITQISRIKDIKYVISMHIAGDNSVIYVHIENRTIVALIFLT